jgi:hypothetical protein
MMEERSEPDYTNGATGDGWGGEPYVHRRVGEILSLDSEEHTAFRKLPNKARSSAVLAKLSKDLGGSRFGDSLLTPFGRRKYDLQISPHEFADMKYGRDFIKPDQYVKDIWIIENLDILLRIHYVDDDVRRVRVTQQELDNLDYAGIPWKVWGMEGLTRWIPKKMRHHE